MYGQRYPEHDYLKASWDIAYWVIAHDYEIPSLIAASEFNLKSQLTGAKGGMLHFVQSIRLVYESPRLGGGLFQIAINACREDIESLMSQEKFQKLLFEVPGLAVDLLYQMTRPVAVKQETG